MTSKDQIRNALLLYGLEDLLHLGWMVQSTSLVTGKERRDPEVLDLTLGAIYELLKAGYARAADTSRDERGMVSMDLWNYSPDAAIAEIKSRLNAVEEARDKDFVVWLELSDEGRKVAERLDAEGCDPFSRSDGR